MVPELWSHELEAAAKESIAHALEEDIGDCDVTTAAIVPEDHTSEGRFVAKANGVLAGIPVVEILFRELDADVEFFFAFRDGQSVNAGTEIGRIRGKSRALLSGERAALNFFQHLSGIATMTRRFVSRTLDSSSIVTDTRKTIPGLRLLEKYAVAAGGGENHRLGLYDMILIKENHIRIVGSIREAIGKAKKFAGNHGDLKIEVEVTGIDEFKTALDCGVDRIMLDNMSVEDITRAISMGGDSVEIEVSGGVDLESIAGLGRTGAHFISVGALTHSAPALDISFLLD